MVRTLGLQPDADKIIAPCLGVIRLQWGDAVRHDDASLPPKMLFDTL